MSYQASILEGSACGTYRNNDMAHRITGYGLIDVKVDKGCCVDGRISHNGFIFNPSHYSMDGFREFMRRDDGTNFDGVAADLDECIHFRPASGGEYDLCLVPPMQSGWVERDGQSDAGTPHRTVSFLSEGPRGYRSVMDVRDGRAIPSAQYVMFLRMYSKYNSTEICDAERLAVEYPLAELACDLGFDTITDVIAYAVPSVPTVIRSLATYLNLFSHPSVILTLRPMVVTYAE